LEATISDELLSSLAPLIEKDLLEVFEDTELFFELIRQNYPICGSKIDWTMALGVVKEVTSDDYFLRDCLLFVERLIASDEIAQTEEVVLLGDSAMDFSVVTKVGCLAESLKYVLEMPQHTYIVPLTGEWCIAFTMENMMTFGRSPEK